MIKCLYHNLGFNSFFMANECILCSFPFCNGQEELEHLNQASDEINRLELQLDVSNMFDIMAVSQSLRPLTVSLGLVIATLHC